MGPGGTYALVAFLAGVLLLLGWLYATSDNPRSWAILKKSLLVFVLPMIFVPGLFLHGLWGIFVWVGLEEGLKAFASTREAKRFDKFWLVALFGIWELAITKPFWGPAVAQYVTDGSRLSMAGEVYATALPALMHAVTAAIYAITPNGRLWIGFAASVAIHGTFNLLVDVILLFPVAVAVETLILGVMLAVAVGYLRRLNAEETNEKRAPESLPTPSNL